MNTTLKDLKLKIKTISETYKDNPTGGWITGDGPIDAKIMFIGEAPGKNEVEHQKPFIGLAGKRFESYLNDIGLNRNEVRITNTCFFRPIKINESKTGRKTISNRPPKSNEIKLFKEILDEEIKLVSPKIVVTLGNVPLKRLTNYKSIGECHGTTIYNKELNTYIFPMYHPSSLTYNRSEKFLKSYEKDWTSLKKIVEK